MLTAADATAQLMQLTDTEPVGVHHQHHGRVGDVDADLDHRGAYQHVDFPRAESRHHRVFLVSGQPTVHQTQAQARQRTPAEPVEQLDDGDRRRPTRLLVVIGSLVVLVDARCDDIGLPAFSHFFGDALPCPVQPRPLLVDEDGVGGDRLTAARQFAQRGGFRSP